jgi:hypothetical protein
VGVQITDKNDLKYFCLPHSVRKYSLFNPWNHRADISAQAYLKRSEKGKK